MDGSKNSSKGLDYAIYLARQCGATVTGIFCVDIPPRSEFLGVGSLKKSFSEEMKKFMESAKIKAAQKGIVFKSKTIQGNVGYNIVKFAHSPKEKFDLIVIGSRGRGAAKEMFFGSTSNFVIHKARIPVLVTK